jgi:hypothetical protein
VVLKIIEKEGEQLLPVSFEPMTPLGLCFSGKTN